MELTVFGPTFKMCFLLLNVSIAHAFIVYLLAFFLYCL